MAGKAVFHVFLFLLTPLREGRLGAISGMNGRR